MQSYYDGPFYRGREKTTHARVHVRTHALKNIAPVKYHHRHKATMKMAMDVEEKLQ